MILRTLSSGVRLHLAVGLVVALLVGILGCGLAPSEVRQAATPGATQAANAPMDATATPAASSPALAVTPASVTPMAPAPAPVASPLLATSTPQPSPTALQPGATVELRREFVAEMLGGQLRDVEPAVDGKAVTLARRSAGYAGRGEIVSLPRRPGIGFNDLVLSWSASTPAGTALRFYVRVQAGGEWSGWYAMGVWRDGHGESVRGQQDGFGRVDVDTLVLARSAEAWQYRVELSTADPTRSPQLRSVSVVVADRSRPPAGPPVALPAGWERELPVPTESQAIQDPAVAWSICSPTSLTMILRYWGVATTVPEVYRGVRDATSGIYGNWPLNTAYAAERGFDAYVTRMYSLDQLRAEIAAGRPVAVSIKYAGGELPGAALNSTSGHLIVVRGFTADGKAIINDPAAPDRQSVRRVVNARDLERVWLRSGGVAYVVSPGA